MENDTHIKEGLFSNEALNRYSSPEKIQDHLLEQYKIYFESADRISSRRQSANSFFVTINTALIALTGYVCLGSDAAHGPYWLVGLSGVILSYMWYRLIRSYRDLNTAKFKVIHEIESHLPISPFDAEWEAVGRGKNRKLYLPFTHIEIYVPWIFLILHIITFIRSFPWEVATNIFCSS
jgi:hypothetical protein